MKTLQEITKEYAKHLVHRTRPDGSEFYCFDDDAPEDAADLARFAFDGELSDWDYAFLDDALGYIDDDMDPDNEDPREYHTYAQHVSWIAEDPGDRLAAIQEAIEELGPHKHGNWLDDMIAYAMQQHQRVVWTRAVEWLTDKTNEQEDDETTED